MKNIIALLLIVLTVNTLEAQESQTTKYEAKNNFLGFYASGTNGFGFSYRHNFGKFGIKFTGLPAGNKNNLYLIGGSQLTYTFFSQENINLFSYIGTNIIYYKCRHCYSLNYEYSDTYISFSQWNAGTGIGMQVPLSRIIYLEVTLGYGIYDFTSWYLLNVDGGFGLFFNF